MLPAELANLLGRVPDTHRGLVVDERDNLCAGFELAFERLEVEGSSPLGPDRGCLAVALADLEKTLSELAVLQAGDLLVPRNIGNRGFHAGRAGPADDNEVVPGTKRGFQNPHTIGIRGAELGA